MEIADKKGTETLKRIFFLAVTVLPIVVVISAIGGWESALSAFTGGCIVLFCAWLTRTAVLGVFADDSRKMNKKIWLRLGWRLLLLVIALYAILHAPWISPLPFIAGLSLFVPALALELIISTFASKQK